MNTPRANWPTPPSKVMKKAHMAQIQESSDPDDTDLDIDERDMDMEIEREGMKFSKKHPFHTKKHVECFEDSVCEDSCECECEPNPCPPHGMKHKKPHCKPPMPPLPERIILAHSFVPWQCYEKAFTPDEALRKGTLFPELWGVYPIPK